MRSLSSKVAVVLGGSQGIGRACALELASYGTKVGVVDIRAPDETGAELERRGAQFCTATADVRSLASVLKARDEVESTLGTPTLVVNSVGVRSFGPILEISDAFWNNTLGVIMTGALNTAKAFCPAMEVKGGGSMVLYSTTTARYSFPWLAHYQAAKAGLVGLMRGMAFELGPKNIRVNCVSPCLVATPDFGDRATFFHREAQHTVLKRLALPNDLAQLTCFLLSDEAGFITGQEIECDGGYSLFAQDFTGWIEERGAGSRPGEDARAPQIPG